MTSRRSGRGVLLEASGWVDVDQGRVPDTDTKLHVNPKVQVVQADQCVRSQVHSVFLNPLYCTVHRVAIWVGFVVTR